MEERQVMVDALDALTETRTQLYGMACCCLAMEIMTGEEVWASMHRLAATCAERTEPAIRGAESALQVDPF